MIAMAVIAIAGTAFLIVSAPRFMGGDPMEGSPWRYAHLVVAGVGIIVGLVWMIRIYRADPEPDQHAWRYRAKR
jgi:hypothetical protein